MSATTNPLDALAPAERAEVELLFNRHRFPAGQELFRQGSPADTAMLLREGTVRLLLELPGERRSEVARLGPGAFLGEPALLRPTHRSLTAVAEDDVVVDVLERQDFQGLRHALRPSSFKVMRTLATNLAGILVATDQRSRQLADDSAAQPDVFPLGATEQPGCSFDPGPFLDRLPFFARFSHTDQQALFELGTLWQLPRGRVLLSEGDTSAGMFVVVRGAVEVLGRPGEPRLALIGPGAPLGVLAPLLGQAPIATCRMREAGTVLQLGPDALDALLRPSQRLSYRFLDALCQGLLDDVSRADRVLARIEGARSRSLA